MGITVQELQEFIRGRITAQEPIGNGRPSVLSAWKAVVAYHIFRDFSYVFRGTPLESRFSKPSLSQKALCVPDFLLRGLFLFGNILLARWGESVVAEGKKRSYPTAVGTVIRGLGWGLKALGAAFGLVTLLLRPITSPWRTFKEALEIENPWVRVAACTLVAALAIGGIAAIAIFCPPLLLGIALPAIPGVAIPGISGAAITACLVGLGPMLLGACKDLCGKLKGLFCGPTAVKASRRKNSSSDPDSDSSPLLGNKAEESTQASVVRQLNSNEPNSRFGVQLHGRVDGITFASCSDHVALSGELDRLLTERTSSEFSHSKQLGSAYTTRTFFHHNGNRSEVVTQTRGQEVQQNSSGSGLSFSPVPAGDE